MSAESRPVKDGWVPCSKNSFGGMGVTNSQLCDNTARYDPTASRCPTLRNRIARFHGISYTR